MFGYKKPEFFIFIIILSLSPGICLANNWIAYSCTNEKFYSLDLETGQAAIISSTPSFWHLTYASNGILYGISRKTDALYRFTEPATGEATLLANLPQDSTGSGITISPDDQSIYFTLNEDELYCYDISNNTFKRLGTITGVYGLSDIEFSADGILYGITGIGYGSKQLYTINPETLQATAIGPELFGIDDIPISSASSIEFAPDGKLYLIISVEGDIATHYEDFEYICTLDVLTGIATMKRDAVIHDSESYYYADTLAIKPSSSEDSDDGSCFISIAFQ